MSFGFGFGFPGGASTAGGPSLSLQFVGSTALSPLVTFTRGSQAMLFDSTGTLAWAPNNVIRNNMMVGAVAGNPGTPPTNWNIVLGGGATGVNREIVGTGVENGITYVDIRLVGTASGNYAITIANEPITGVPAINGQTWTYSVWVKIAAGSFSGFNTPQIIVEEYSAASAYLAGQNTNVATPTSTLTRISATRTNTNASTAFEYAGLRYYIANGQSVDITLRIGMPQLERGSVATAVNATSGTAYYGPRFDYDPSTLAARGLLIEEQRVNSIRNNTMQGAVAGTPGTLPTNWSVGGSGLGTLSSQVVGTGTVNGITYIDWRIFGTTSTTDTALVTELSTQVAALQGQTWSNSCFLAIVGGSISNITDVNINTAERNSSGGILGQFNSTGIKTSLISTLQRFSLTSTLIQATTAFVQPRLNITFNSGVAIDITLRIGLPQLEQGAFATSVIPTTGSTATRNADVASVNTLSPWLNAAENTFVVESSRPQVNNGNATLIEGSEVSGLTIAADGTGNRIRVLVRQGTSRIDTASNAAITVADQIRKNAAATSSSGSAAAQDGVLVTVSATPAQTDWGTSLRIGSRLQGGSNVSFWNGYIRRISAYPRRLSNNELQAITA